jgi:hypothetical protein
MEKLLVEISRYIVDIRRFPFKPELVLPVAHCSAQAFPILGNVSFPLIHRDAMAAYTLTVVQLFTTLSITSPSRRR